MMLLRPSRVWALLCLFLCFNLAVAGLVHRRDGPPPTTTAAAPSSTEGGRGDETTSSLPTSTAASTSSIQAANNNTTSSTASSIAPIPTAAGPLNTTLFNITIIPPGELPIQPTITPGWAVAGVILVASGTVYALVGIKTKWLHTFFSTAFLASLGTAVLIVYVMAPPVSVAVQGAYVVAVVVTGCILGGAAIVFKEVTECLGCILGGFSLSMWLLTQQDGGLLQETSARIIFISAFCAGVFALYFSRYTRTYALIGSISFAGATAAVLGIDCFSRAGLKEFWVYLWALNSNLFPLGVDTYPLTRGIRVELAVTVLIFLAGIVSQLRLWKMIQERRAKRDAQRAEGDRELRTEEENVGRQVEEDNARERRQWEAVYGDGPKEGAVSGSADSGVGDMESEKRLRHSQGTATTTRPPSMVEEPIELSDLPAGDAAPPPPPKPTAAEAVLAQSESGGMVTVRVARDDVPQGHGVDGTAEHDDGKMVWAVGADGDTRLVPAHSMKSSEGPSSPAPNVVALPFRVPSEHGEYTQNDDRSSVATFADEEVEPSVQGGKRGSITRRFSKRLMRSLSQRSKRSTLDAVQIVEAGESREELVISRQSRNADNDSVAANSGDESDDDDDETNTVRNEEWPRSAQVAALPNREMTPTTTGEKPRMSLLHPSVANLRGTDRPISTAETVSTSILNPSEAGERERAESVAVLDEEAPTAEAKGIAVENETEEVGSSKESDEKSRRAKSVASVDSVPASLTKGNLPRALSRIAMSYRTNEWAKHLSHAELPEPETLQLNEYPEEASEKVPKEVPAPLNVAELQQTVENAALPPAAPRSSAIMASQSQSHVLNRSAPRNSTVQFDQHTNIGSSSSAPPLQHAYAQPYRTASAAFGRQSVMAAQPIAEETDDPAAPVPGAEDGGSYPNSMSGSPAPPDASTSSLGFRAPVPGVVSYASPQTLIGMREMFLRSKSQAAFYVPPAQDPVASLSPIPSQPASEAGSLYNYPIYASALPTNGGGRSSLEVQRSFDVDDLPLSQRRELMRQSSLAGLSGSGSGFVSPALRPASIALNPAAMASAPAMVSGLVPALAADSVPFNSHQPQRGSTVPPPAVRDAALASFRQSVAEELRAGTPFLPAGNANAVYGGGVRASASMASLPGALAYGRDGAVRRSIDVQRGILLGRKEAEAQRREAERLEKERGDRMFEERMRRGDMLEAHREAMRRLQGEVK